MTPPQAIELFQILGGLSWRKLDPADHFAFCDAGDDARIAEIDHSGSDSIACLLGYTGSPIGGLLAIIGGDALQIELHGCAADGEPISFCLPISASPF